MWNRIKNNKILNAIGGLILLYEVCININYTANFCRDYINPQGYKKAIYEKYKVRAYGDIEEDEYKTIDKLFTEYQKEKQFVKSIEILPRDLKRLCFFDQIKYVFTNIEGYTNGGNISIFKGAPYFNYAHEMKHPLIRKVLDSDPSFKEKWEALCKDENGNSLYKYSLANFLHHVSASLEGPIENRKDLEKEGFLSEHSRANIEEDAAILSSDIDSFALDSNRIKEIFSDPDKWRLHGKIKLLEQYGLVGKGTPFL